MAKITSRKPNLSALILVPRWIPAAAVYFRECFGKFTRNVGLPEPRFPIPSPEDRPALSTRDAIGNAPKELAVDFGKGPSSTRSNRWSLELLRQSEERQFEELVAAYFREESFRVEIARVGNYEGIDIELYKKGKQDLFAIVQCKVNHTQKVGVRCIRELLGAMIHARVPRGILVTTGDFTREAVEFARQHPIILMTGEMLIKDILSYPDDSKTRLFNFVKAGRSNVKDVSPGVIPEAVSNAVAVAQVAVPEVVAEEASNSRSSPSRELNAEHMDSNADAEQRLSVRTADPDVAAANESNTLEFFVPKSAENGIAPDAVPDDGTKTSPAVANIQTDEVSNSIDFDLLDSVVLDAAKEANKEKEHSGRKTAQDDALEKDSNTIDFPPLEVPDRGQRTKPAEFFGVFK